MGDGWTRFGPSEIVVDRVVGHNLSTNVRYDNNYPSIVNRGFSAKSDSIHSDRVSPTPFSSESVWTVADVPYTMREEEWRNNHTELVEWKESTHHISPQVWDPAFWAPPDNWSARLGNAEDRSITVARDRLRNKDSFNLGVALAEARSTAELLADTGGYMAKGLISLRRHANSLKTGRDKILAAGGAWLQGYYGWGSLARDAFDLDERLRREVSNELLIRSSCTTKIDDSHVGGPFEEHSEWKGLARVGYTAKIEDAFARSLDDWGLINPFSIVWELVPYSFCVDWLVPVGNTLSSLTATAGLEFRGGYLSTVTNGEITHHRRARPWESCIQEGLHKVRVKRFDRKVLTHFEPPRLYANENPFSTPRILSGIALITQAVLGR